MPVPVRTRRVQGIVGVAIASTVSRQVRRQLSQQDARQAQRRTGPPAGATAAPATATRAVATAPPPGGVPCVAPDAPRGVRVRSRESAQQAVPLYEAVVTWLDTLLAGSGHSRPARKRLALLGAALLAGDGERGTPAGVTHTAFGLKIGTATQEASVAKRVARLLDDPHLDPQRLLPDLTTALLPVLLETVLQTHTHTVHPLTRRAPAGAPSAVAPVPAVAPVHHARWAGVRLVIDESTAATGVHVVVVGLAYRGGVVPLGLRTWPQNEPLPEGAYWAAVGSLLWEVSKTLPAALRPHVLLLADRGYGVPVFVDLLASLGWQWLVRVQGLVRVRFPDGTERPLRTLVPRVGTTWAGSSAPLVPLVPATSATSPPATASPPADDPAVRVAVFKTAGWRHVHVVAVWAPEQDEPWLLLTTLPATGRASIARCAEYASRWSIERLFLSWKSHGWDVATCGSTSPARVARLLTGYVLATWWLLAAALPGAQVHLEELASRATRRTGQPPTRTCQLRLALFPPARPWAAKSSLFTQGRRLFARTTCRTTTPPLCWVFPEWDAPPWSQQCRAVSQEYPADSF